MKPINLKKLELLLTLKAVNFEYFTKGGVLRIAKGTNNPSLIPLNIAGRGGIYSNGNLTYYDLNVNDWRTVSASSTVAAETADGDTTSYFNKTTVSNLSTSLLFTPGFIGQPELVDLLNKSIVKFKYQKPDGSVKETYGTTDPKRHPAITAPAVKTVGGHIPYYNIETDSWKTIAACSRIELIDAFDVPLKQ